MMFGGMGDPTPRSTSSPPRASTSRMWPVRMRPRRTCRRWLTTCTPSKYKDIGAQMPKGILLVGPPGTGKTMLAKAVAGESNVPLLLHVRFGNSSRCSWAWALQGPRPVQTGQGKGPCIVFIDEIDAIGQKRNGGQYGGNDEARTDPEPASDRDGRF